MSKPIYHTQASGSINTGGTTGWWIQCPAGTWVGELVVVYVNITNGGNMVPSLAGFNIAVNTLADPNYWRSSAFWKILTQDDIDAGRWACYVNAGVPIGTWMTVAVYNYNQTYPIDTIAASGFANWIPSTITTNHVDELILYAAFDVESNPLWVTTLNTPQYWAYPGGWGGHFNYNPGRSYYYASNNGYWGTHYSSYQAKITQYRYVNYGLNGAWDSRISVGYPGWGFQPLTNYVPIVYWYGTGSSQMRHWASQWYDPGAGAAYWRYNEANYPHDWPNPNHYPGMGLTGQPYPAGYPQTGNPGYGPGVPPDMMNAGNPTGKSSIGFGAYNVPEIWEGTPYEDTYYTAEVDNPVPVPAANGWGQIGQSADGFIYVQCLGQAGAGIIQPPSPVSPGYGPRGAVQISIAIRGTDSVSWGAINTFFSEVAYVAAPNYRITQQSIDVAVLNTSAAYITQSSIEILHCLPTTLQYTLDACVVHRYDVKYTLDTKLQGTYSKTYTLDYGIYHGKRYSLDTELFKRYNLNYTITTKTWGTYARSYTLDTMWCYIYDIHHKTSTALHAIDEFIYHTTASKLFWTKTPYFTTDVGVCTTYEIETTTSIALHGTLTIGHGTWTFLLQPGAGIFHTTDIDIHGTATIHHTTDILRKAIKAPQHTTDTGTKSVDNKLEHTTDTEVLYFGIPYFTTDIGLLGTYIQLHTTSTILLLSSELEHTTGTKIFYAGNPHFLTDTILSGTVEKYHHTDLGLIKIDISPYHTTDTITEAFWIIQHYTDILNYATLSRGHFTDTTLLKLITTAPVEKQYRFTYTDDYGTIYTTTWKKSTLNTLDITTIVEQPYVWGEPASGSINNKQLYRRGIITIQRMILESTTEGYIIKSEGHNQYIGDILTSFNCNDPPINPFKYIMNNAMMDNTILEIEDSPCYVDQNDTLNVVWADVDNDGDIIPSGSANEINLEYIDVWNN